MKGQFTISDIIIFVSFIFIVLLFFGFVSVQKLSVNAVIHEKFQQHSSKYILTSYLKQPMNADVDGDGVVDAETIADLVVLGRNDASARAVLESDLARTLSEINSEIQGHRVEVVYPNKERIKVGGFVFHGRARAAEMAFEAVYLPTPEGENIKIVITTSPYGEIHVWGINDE